MQEKGKFPSLTQPNLRRVHELSSSAELNPKIDEFKAVITLISGKEVKQKVTKPAKESHEVKEAEPEEEVIKENAVKKRTPPHFFRNH